jgi:transposase InsO family protein
MSAVRLGVGSRLRHDGELVEVIELHGGSAVLRDAHGHVGTVSVVQLLTDAQRSQLLPERGATRADGEPVAVALSQADDALLGEVASRAGHVREVLTGYRSGSAEVVVPGEPRVWYAPDVALMQRYRNKAAELGVSVGAVRKWVSRFERDGEAGLLPQSLSRRRGPLDGVDERWLAAARAVIDGLTDASTITIGLALQHITARVEREHGPGVVRMPQRTKGYALLNELSRGRNTFTGSAKGRREIAGRPEGVYGRLRATRPGEYLVLDTTPLDVYAMEPVTLRWVGAALTVAMDLYTRCIVGVCLTPVSAKAVDVASVIYQALCPPAVPEQWPAYARWPYHGWPTGIVVDADRVAGRWHDTVTPPLHPDTVICDNERIYVSEHVLSACTRVGISVQPARLYRPTDKPVERFFRTLRQGLLEVLPGYKGPDVFSRGKRIETQAFYFLNELEDMIREWTATVYHHRPHDGLVEVNVPGMRISPAQMFDHGIARAGYLQVPADADLAYEFLQVVWRRIHHYGVEIGGLRYNGAGLRPYANSDSGYHSATARGRWPIHLNPNDVSRVFFRDPQTGVWHTLWWEHQAMLRMPFSADALAHARRLATAQQFPDAGKALADLLQRWNIGLADTPAERRIALRLAAEQATLRLPTDPAPQDPAPVPSVASLPSEFDADEDFPDGDVTGVEQDDAPDLGDAAFYADAWQALR